MQREQKASELFSNTYYESLEFGTAIHELFQKVTWVDQIDIEELIQDWHKRSLAEEDFKQRVTQQFCRTLTFEEVRQVLSHPTGNIELWREKRFEVVMDGQWVTGAFDRVMIERDVNGKALSATILDFKSDEAEDDSSLKHIAERYRPQMLLYRKALSQILKLDNRKIAIQILFTQSGIIYDLSS